MSNTISVFGIGGIEINQFPVTTHFWSRYFTNRVFSTQSKISYDAIYGDSGMAEFVSCCVQPHGKDGEIVMRNEFQLAYVKEYDLIDNCNLDTPVEGEPLNANWTQEQRLAQIVSLRQTRQMNRIQRRMEWMAVKSLTDGKYLINGEKHGTAMVDFGRDTANTYTPAVSWALTAGTPLDDIENMGQIALANGGGAITDIYFGTTAYQAARDHHQINDIIVNNGLLIPGLPDFSLSAPQQGAVYKGMMGNVRVWVYSSQYKDENGVIQQLFPAEGVLVVSEPSVSGITAFGAVKHNDNLGPTEAYSFQELCKGGLGRELYTYVSPLVVPRNANAAAFATVVF